LSDYCRHNEIFTGFNEASISSFVILSDIEKRIKEKIEKIGTPLKDWDIQINYGIKTGYNEAFIIDGATRNALIKKSSPTDLSGIIRPILRGRDIKKYGYEFADRWLICTFPSLNIDIENYPAIKEHLLSFGYDRLKQTGETGARKKTNNKWFETQDAISYFEDFDKPKIVWLELTDKPKFSIELEKMCCLAGTFILTRNDNLHTILAILNSKLIEWLFDGMCNSSGTGTNQWKKFVVEKIPMPKVNKQIDLEIQMLLQNNDYKNIDKLVCQLYDLSEEEIQFINSQ
jgi:hypothetical protein